MSRYVLDSFALLARYWSEPGASRVEELLRAKGHRRWTSVINLGEVFYRIAREENVRQANTAINWMRLLPVQPVDADWALTRIAALIKSQYALAYGDCFAAALAQRFNASVVTGDREFLSLERDGVIRVEWLPRR